MDRLAVAATARAWLAQQIRQAGFSVVVPSSSKSNLSTTIQTHKIEFQILASSSPSFRVRRSVTGKPHSLVVYVWNVDDPERCVAYGMTPHELLAFAEEQGYTKRSTWSAYRETGIILVEGNVSDWLEQHKLTTESLKTKILAFAS